MNISLLPIYYSKESLTVRMSDYLNVYLLPTICGFGIVTSLICIIVSLKRDESNAKLFDYIIINSFIDFLFLWTQFFLFIIRCGVLCPYGSTYGAKFYEAYIFLYTGYVLVTSQLLLSIYIAYERSSMFSAKAGNKKPIGIYKVYLICFVLSVVSNLPQYVISREIRPIGVLIPDPNSTYYEILYAKAYKSEYQTPTANFLLTAYFFIKDALMFVVLFVLNIWLCVRFRAYLKTRKTLIKKVTKSAVQSTVVTSDQQSMSNDTAEKRSQTQTEKKENNFTLLTLLYCLIYLVGNFIDCFSTVAVIFSLDIYVKYGFINIMGNILFFLSHGVHLFLYYFFNNVFRKLFNDYFRLGQMASANDAFMKFSSFFSSH